jgi:hypothetical protein
MGADYQLFFPALPPNYAGLFKLGEFAYLDQFDQLNFGNAALQQRSVKFAAYFRGRRVVLCAASMSTRYSRK